MGEGHGAGLTDEVFLGSVPGAQAVRNARLLLNPHPCDPPSLATPPKTSGVTEGARVFPAPCSSPGSACGLVVLGNHPGPDHDAKLRAATADRLFASLYARSHSSTGTGSNRPLWYSFVTPDVNPYLPLHSICKRPAGLHERAKHARVAAETPHYGLKCDSHYESGPTRRTSQHFPTTQSCEWAAACRAALV